VSTATTDISRHIWNSKYRCDRPYAREAAIEDTWRRVARACAAVEPRDRAVWENAFFDLLSDFKFLPGGRIYAGAGTDRKVTLFNCFVMGPIEDSMPGIFRALQEGAITMQQGGGIGYDFSTLRPRGTHARTVGSIASGPVSFMDVWDAMCGTILSTGSRRGAMMATLRCDHPDVEEFITAKHQPGRLRRFNLSLQISDAFLDAVRDGGDWPLVFPAATIEVEGGDTVMREWPGLQGEVLCRVVRRVPARGLWEKILRATYDFAEPGVLFIDRINQLNNLWYCEKISATNPCGEIPLPSYGACDLGSINLTRFVRSPFKTEAELDLGALGDTARTAVRLLDNVIDASRFPLPQQADQAKRSRRIGLGITGLADTLLMLGINYDSDQAIEVAEAIMRTVCHAAYRGSIALAGEKGAFPQFDRSKYLQAKFIRTLPHDIQEAIDKSGIRNSHLLAIAPTGTISLLAGNVSSGLEPIFAASHRRRILDENGHPREFLLTDYAVALWRSATGQSGVPEAFIAADDVPVRAHLAMQAALQPFIDNSISKTINVPEQCPFDEFKGIYDLAYDMGLKGCTTFRPNPVTGAVLSKQAASSDAPHCCALEREAD
jgi:ribonucleoside-diphosphate reductase alpha chain